MASKRVFGILIALVLTGSLAHAEGRARRILYRASQAAFAVASVVDVSSSWGKYERNPLMRGADGRMGRRNVGMKIGVVAGIVAAQELASRRSSKAEVAATVTNFGAAGLLGVTAGRNFTVGARRAR